MPRKKRLHTITPKKKKKLLVEIDPTKSPGKDPFSNTEKHRRNDGPHRDKSKYRRRDKHKKQLMSASVDRVVSRYLSKTSADFDPDYYSVGFFKDLHKELGSHRDVSFSRPSPSRYNGRDGLILYVQLKDPKYGTVSWPDAGDDEGWRELKEKMVKAVRSVRQLKDFDYALDTYEIENHYNLDAKLYIFGRK